MTDATTATLQDSEREQILAVCRAAKAATRSLATLTRAQKDVALHALADALQKESDVVIAANEIDLAAARASGTDPAIIDRLTLTTSRIDEIADAVRDIAELPDPIGEVVRGYRRPNGLEMRQVRVPMGVVGTIYEARPNVTVDAAVLCLKSGNAALLRGSSSARHTNSALIDVMRAALAGTQVPINAIQWVPGTTHESVQHLLTARGLVDLLVPRGGAGLIRSVVEGATVPVIETGVGNCHVYLDASAPTQRAADIIVNSKTQRVSVCNAAETLLVHADAAQRLLPTVLGALADKGVTIHGDDRIRPFCEAAGIAFVPVTDKDWGQEYYSLDLAAGIVDDIDMAIEHIRTWSSGHTEAIVTDSLANADRFVRGVDSAAVMVNASTRFTDGGEFGFGAELGISTQKLHARGPMGLPELTSTTWVVFGDGHVRP